jgi:hypothetical protein
MEAVAYGRKKVPCQAFVCQLSQCQDMWLGKACGQARHVANIDRQIKRDSCLLSYDGRTL